MSALRSQRRIASNALLLIATCVLGDYPIASIGVWVTLLAEISKYFLVFGQHLQIY